MHHPTMLSNFQSLFCCSDLPLQVFPEGYVCLSLLKEVVPEHLGKVSGWMPSISVKEILLSIQVCVHTEV